jgi:hypothetical protein
MWGRSKRPRGRPRKSLGELVADGTFLARRHAELLAGESISDPTLAALRQLYRQAGDDRQRRRVALQFERLVRESLIRSRELRELLVREFAPDLTSPARSSGLTPSSATSSPSFSGSTTSRRPSLPTDSVT